MVNPGVFKSVRTACRKSRMQMKTWGAAKRLRILSAMKYYALIYDVVDNFAERRMPFRETHLKMVREAHERGAIVMAGALGDPISGALIVFRVQDGAVVENFARTDPYVTQGVVTRWQVKPWNVVIGGAEG